MICFSRKFKPSPLVLAVLIASLSTQVSAQRSPTTPTQEAFLPTVELAPITIHINASPSANLVDRRAF